MLLKRNREHSERSEAMNVDEEVERLKEEIQRLGKVQDDGSYKVSTIFTSINRIPFFSLLFVDLFPFSRSTVLVPCRSLSDAEIFTS